MPKQLLLIFCVILFSQFADAAYVEQVKGKRALIVLDGLNVKKGQIIETIDPLTRKKTSFMRVRAIKSNKAIAQVLKGKPAKNQEVHPRATSSKASSKKSMPTTAKSSSSSKSQSNFAIGGLLGVGFDSMEVIIGSPQEKIEQSGMGISVSGAADFWLTNWFSLRAVLGMEQFNASGDGQFSSCEGTNACETKITYVTALAFGRIHITEGLWVGPGLGLQHPMTVKSNNVDPGFGTTAVYGFGGGMDISLGQNMYIPVQFEYGMQPKSDLVATSYYGGRIGLMLRY